MRTMLASAALALVLVTGVTAASFEARTLDGSQNNRRNAQWGAVGTNYLRVARANYADGKGALVSGPLVRYVSNRIFNDVSQNLFSENGVTQWGFAWGQFMDHVFGLRQEVGGESLSITFNANDRLEQFTNELGSIPFSRTPAAPGTGVSSTREQINTVSSYIDAWNVYGGTDQRLEWLRDGSLDGRSSNNRATLLMPGGYLPQANARGNAAAAPAMARDGRLRLPGASDHAVIAGDVRANENIALTAIHTLFAREHNRIVSRLPRSLSDEEKFQIARRVVGATEQVITYEEFLPAMGLRLSRYDGYDPNVNAGLANEFAVVGYRGHSMIHGELEPFAPVGTWSRSQLQRFEDAGIEVEEEEGNTVLVIPLNIAFFNPDLLRDVGLGPVLAGLGGEPEYKNDEQIDNQLRSVLFQVPAPGNANPAACLDGPDLPDCFTGVVDLGAIDIARGRDHGMPRYNDLRRAYGLRSKDSFTDITGERTDRFPTNDPQVSRTRPLDDPDILDFVALFDADGNAIELGSEAADGEAVVGIRRTTLAARLRALYDDPDRLDAFVGMVSERHVPGTEMGELQAAIWRRQFEALRDGDRFFYRNDPVLEEIRRQYGIDYRKTLEQVIELNTNVNVQDNVFKVAE
jgi:hypothetical protein